MAMDSRDSLTGRRDVRCEVASDLATELRAKATRLRDMAAVESDPVNAGSALGRSAIFLDLAGLIEKVNRP